MSITAYPLSRAVMLSAQTCSKVQATAMKHWTVEYLNIVLEQKNWSMNHLATEAGVASSTINRPLREKDWPHGLSAKTVAKIHTASGIDPTPFMPQGMAEPGAMYLGSSLGKRPETTADRTLEGLVRDAVSAEQLPNALKKNEIKISVAGSIAQIVATVDREGLAKLKAKLAALEEMLDD